MSKQEKIQQIIDEAFAKGEQEYQDIFLKKRGRKPSPGMENSRNELENIKNYIIKETRKALEEFKGWNNTDIKATLCETIDQIIISKRDQFSKAFGRIDKNQAVFQLIRFDKWINNLRDDTLQKIKNVLAEDEVTPPAALLDPQKETSPVSAQHLPVHAEVTRTVTDFISERAAELKLPANITAPLQEYTLAVETGDFQGAQTALSELERQFAELEARHKASIDTATQEWEKSEMNAEQLKKTKLLSPEGDRFKVTS